MQIAVLTTSFPLAPGSVSGIFVQRLIQNMPAQTHTVVIAPCASKHTGAITGERYELICFRYAPRGWQQLAHLPGGIPTAIRSNKLRIMLLPTFLLSMFIATLRIARKSDIVHANWSINGVVAGIAGWITHTPVITTLRGSDVALAENSPIFRFTLRLCIRLSTRIVAVSHALARSAAALSPEHASKIIMIPNGVDTQLLRLAHTAGASGAFRLTTIANLIPEKGVHTILQALSLMPDLEGMMLKIVGDGPEYHRLKALADTLGIAPHVSFLGKLSPSDIPACLADTDVFILASIREGRPNVILESLATGTPVVASDIDGISELVCHNQTGLLFKTGDPADLAKQIERLHTDPVLAAEISSASRRFIEENNLTWPETAARYVDLYDETLHSRTQQPE
jgi:glycosyltransferase involved in cell wall biosynthesis